MNLYQLIATLIGLGLKKFKTGVLDAYNALNLGGKSLATVESERNSAIATAKNEAINSSNGYTDSSISSNVTSKLGVANGIATTGSDGKLAITQVPAIAITDTFVVADQAAMLAIVCETGDVAVRTDISKCFILKAEPASNLANWQELLTPASPVQSVFGRTGNVTLTEGDVTGVTGSYSDFETAFNAALNS